jgi:hypothetical protein
MDAVPRSSHLALRLQLSTTLMFHELAKYFVKAKIQAFFWGIGCVFMWFEHRILRGRQI